MRKETSGRDVALIATLLFVSGLSALVFQVTWMREFRLIFGASTAAGAAVLAIFMGGLGFGSAWFGPRADRDPAPLCLYARLIVGISLFAFVSPFLIQAVRAIYVSTGGQMTLGVLGATATRLLLAAVILAVPTVLMGGTLPAAVKAVTSAADRNRRHLATLYGLNTLGAVAGAFVCTFYLLEHYGNRQTLWLACALNLLAGLVAWKHGQTMAPGVNNADSAAGGTPAETEAEAEDAAALPPRSIFAAAATVGFAFFLMEMVWYRMLGPILGGSTYTFGLILTVALAGIGFGGWAYSFLFRGSRVTPRAFALTCALEALLIGIPFALGDSVAFFTLALQDMTVFGFGGTVIGWGLVAGVVVFPAAFVSGVQFPLLIGLLGQGGRDIGRQTGYTCALNTIGAIAGSLAGGFGLLPLLSAPGCWKLVIILLGWLALLVAFHSMQKSPRGKAVILTAFACVMLSFLCAASTGPTAFWRHSPIGAGRLPLPSATINERKGIANMIRHNTIWEADGIEGSVAIQNQNGIAFVVNGKVDGNALLDAGTQIMLGLVGTILHAEPKETLVVGLGTGESAGWLAEVETMQRVDVVELEPALDEMARRCSPVNFDVMNHPKVNRIYNDAREVLLTAPTEYDLIVSEPSNPYRAGIATLFTREFYESCRDRMRSDGLFLQWLQAYEIDSTTVRTVFATLRSVFPHVQVYQTKPNDMMLICSMEPVVYDAERLQARLQAHPYREAMIRAWRVHDREGFLSHFVADAPLIDLVARQEGGVVNTDDRNRVEYGFARTVGKNVGFNIEEVRRVARQNGWHQPSTWAQSDPPIDWRRVEHRRAQMYAQRKLFVPEYIGTNPKQLAYARALWALEHGRSAEGLTQLSRSEVTPGSPGELFLVGLAQADLMRDEARLTAETLRAFSAPEADLVLALLSVRREEPESAAMLLKLLQTLKEYPWMPTLGGDRLFQAIEQIRPRLDEEALRTFFETLAEPLALGFQEEKRLGLRLSLAQHLDPKSAVEALEAYEPNPVWSKNFLAFRQTTYAATNHPRTKQAEQDLLEYLQNAPAPFSILLSNWQSDADASPVGAMSGQPGPDAEPQAP